MCSSGLATTYDAGLAFQHCFASWLLAHPAKHQRIAERLEPMPTNGRQKRSSWLWLSPASAALATQEVDGRFMSLFTLSFCYSRAFNKLVWIIKVKKGFMILMGSNNVLSYNSVKNNVKEGYRSTLCIYWALRTASMYSKSSSKTPCFQEFWSLHPQFIILLFKT